MNKKKPLVSIIIPVFNSEEYISETLDSCINQEYKNIEIVIVDDGSTDLSYDVCLKYKNRHKFIYLYKQENKGAPAARNLAFTKSSGSYIQYLDADDLISEDKISNQVELLYNELPTTISYTKFIKFSKKIIFEEKKYNQPMDFSNPVFFLTHLLKNGWLQTSCWLVHRKLVLSAGNWIEDLTRNQDGDFFGRIILNSKKGIYSNNGFVSYRILNPNSITSKKRDLIYFESYMKSYFQIIDLIKGLNNGEIKFLVAKKINRFYERLILLNSNKADMGRFKMAELGFEKLEPLQDPLVRYFKCFLGYKNTIKLKLNILKIIDYCNCR